MGSPVESRLFWSLQDRAEPSRKEGKRPGELPFSVRVKTRDGFRVVPEGTRKVTRGRGHREASYREIRHPESWRTLVETFWNSTPSTPLQEISVIFTVAGE
jgi:hypothetical protein